MKTKIYSFILFCAVIMIAQNSNAQDCGGRYHDLIFSNVTITSNLTYSTSNGTTLKLDVYQPTGDTASMRPLIIMAHGGSFVSGNKTNDNVCTQICNNYAKRGYVCASIDYRLGNLLGMTDSATAITTVMKAISDGKSAVRFFRKDAATTNTYKIDPTKIFCGGNSAGAVLYAHCAFIDSLNEAPTNLRSIITANGGIEGNSGNDGYSSEMTALINLAGGLNVPEFVGPGNKPSFNAQGSADATVPYMCANAQSNLTPVRLCGLGAMQPLYDQFALNNYSIVYPGEGHVPWQSNAAEMTQIDTTCANFLLQFVCTGTTTSVKEITNDNLVQIYPNPAKDFVNIFFKDISAYTTIQLIDATGRAVNEATVNTAMISMDIHQLSGGIYFVKVMKANGSSLIRKIMID